MTTMLAAPRRVITRLHDAFVPPELATHAIEASKATSKDFVVGGQFGVECSRKTHEFFELDGDGYIETRAGLVPRLVELCHRNDQVPQVEDRSCWPILEQAAEQLSETTSDSNRAMLDAVATNPRGQITSKRGREGVKQLLDILDLFRQSRVLVVTPNVEDRDTLHGRLSAKLKRPVSTHRAIPWRARDRVTVVTSKCFAGISVVNFDFHCGYGWPPFSLPLNNVVTLGKTGQ